MLSAMNLISCQFNHEETEMLKIHWGGKMTRVTGADTRRYRKRVYR